MYEKPLLNDAMLVLQLTSRIDFLQKGFYVDFEINLENSLTKD